MTTSGRVLPGWGRDERLRQRVGLGRPQDWGVRPMLHVYRVASNSPQWQRPFWNEYPKPTGRIGVAFVAGGRCVSLVWGGGRRG
jgi:hypothetical protein